MRRFLGGEGGGPELRGNPRELALPFVSIMYRYRPVKLLKAPLFKVTVIDVGDQAVGI